MMRVLFVMALVMLPIPVVAQMWVARYNGPGDSVDCPYAMTVDRAGNIYVTGESGGSGTSRDYATIKYSCSGDELWVARYDGPANSVDRAYALAVDKTGNVYVTGGSSGLGTSADYATIKYNSFGLEQWVKRYNGPDSDVDYARALAIDETGNVYVTGGSRGLGYVTIKYDSSGNQQWIVGYDSPYSNAKDYAIAVVIDDSGSVYVTGSSGGDSYPDYVTIKYSSSGDLLWVARFGTYGPNSPRAMIMDSTRERIYVTGYTQGISSDYVTIAYDFLGQELWVARYEGCREDTAFAIALDSVGNVCVTGRKTHSYPMTSGYWTIKYNSRGSVLWMKGYDGPCDDNDAARAIAVDKNCNVYVTGYSYGLDRGRHYATVKYSPWGDLLWTARYDGPHHNNAATAMVIDDSGYVYVTGGSDGSHCCYDYLTIKYHPSGPGVEESATRTQPVFNGNKLEIFPNPFSTSAVLRARGIQGIARIAVYDIGGRKVSTYPFGQSRITIGAELDCGIYFLRCVSPQGTPCNDIKPIKITKVKMAR